MKNSCLSLAVLASLLACGESTAPATPATQGNPAQPTFDNPPPPPPAADLPTPPPAAVQGPPAVDTRTAAERGLVVTTLKEGSGDQALALGMTGRFHYTGWLAGGEVFDSSRFNPRGDETAGYGEPREFAVREGGLIQGWTLGLPGMKVGEVRRLVVPAELGYGATGGGGRVPPNAVLTFDIELVELVK
jgi:hypothetical protein